MTSSTYISSTKPAGRQSRWLIGAGVILAGGSAWWLLGFWVPAGSERLYLVVPPVGLALVVLLAAEPGRELRTRLRAALPFVGFLLLFAAAYNLLLTIPALPGPWLQGLRPGEVLLTAYFLIALRVLAAVPLGLARPPLGRLLDRLLPLKGEPGGKRSFLRKHAVELLLAPLLLPLVLGVIYVHRFKVPNLPATSEHFPSRPHEDVWFVAEDGRTIRGWFFPAKAGTSARTLIFCHGMGGNRSIYLPLILPVGDTLQANILAFDFRGHGASDGHTVTFGGREKLDVRAAIEYLRRARPEQAREIIGFGISMGTAALVPAAAEVEPPLDAVILDCPYATAEELIDSMAGLVPAAVRPVLSQPAILIGSLDSGCWLPDVRSIDHIDRLRAPLLIIHDRDDELIPVEQAERLHKRAAEPKELWLTEGYGHGRSLLAGKEYLERVQRFVNTAADKRR